MLNKLNSSGGNNFIKKQEEVYTKVGYEFLEELFNAIKNGHKTSESIIKYSIKKCKKKWGATYSEELIEKHIEIIGGGETENLGTISKTFPISYKITIKNLEFTPLLKGGHMFGREEQMGYHEYQLDLISAINSSFANSTQKNLQNVFANPQRYGLTHIVLENNLFGDQRCINFLLEGNLYLTLKHNTFRYADLKFTINKDNYNFLHIGEKNKFQDGYLTIGGIYFKEKDDVISNSYIRIKDNQIDRLSVAPLIHTSIEGKNKIKGFLLGKRGDETYINSGGPTKKLEFCIDWEAYSKFHHESNYIYSNRELLLSLRNRTIERQDKHQEVIINRELIRCEHARLKNEPWRRSWQEKLILYFGSWVSAHGTSLWKPFSWLAGVTLIATGLVVYCSNTYSIHDSLKVFITMLYPLIPNGTPFDLLWIYSLQKVSLYLFTYELLRVGRRFTVK